MRVIRDAGEIDEAGDSLQGTVVAIGNFDGVHLGHQKLLRCCVERARADGLEAAVLTFEPHPAQILAPARAPKLLTPLAEKAALIEATGIGLLWALPFTLQLSEMSPSEFVEQILVRDLKARVVVVGPNFRFGHRQQGDVRLLAELGQSPGQSRGRPETLGREFEVDIVDAVWVRGQMVSSTRIRDLVAGGRVPLAGRLLGRPFSVTGPIVRGLGIGREQTVPTLNLAPLDRQLPKAGVYVTRTRLAAGVGKLLVLGGSDHASVTNVGRKPTFGEHELAVESYLLDYRGGPIEADEMQIQFLHRLRDERKFPDAASLRAQIIKDAERSLSFFRRLRLFPLHKAG